METPILFLSHNKNDKPFVRRLGQSLEQHGVKVWIDEAEIHIGDSLIQKISSGLLGAKYLLVILSPNSVASSWVQKELEIATTMEIADHQICVLPILYKDCDIPLFLQGKLYADFRNKKMFQRSLINLLDTVLPEGFTEHILSAVRSAVAAEFWTYKQLPNIDTTRIDECFADSSARARIMSLIQRHLERGWIISNPGNPSTHKILELKLKQVKGDIATVVTEEYWYLRWFDVHLAKYNFIYNYKNSQTYTLVRDAHGKWLVDINIYESPKIISAGTRTPA